MGSRRRGSGGLMKLRGVTSKVLALSLGLIAASCGFGKDKDKEKPLPPPPNGFLADTGFRPATHGFAFKNSGGQFPKTPGIVDTNVVAKMFGKEACVGGALAKCKLTPPAMEWAAMINRAINGGRCEGMAVASLTMFQKTDDPARYGKGATSAHGVNPAAVTPLIAYYWAWQTVDPMQRETVMQRRKTTPANAIDQLSSMMKGKQLATLAIWAPRPQRGGHAVTPYAIEHKGNDVYWVRIYDNNYPDKERYIVIDKKANTWRYDVAALNPDKPKLPWYGDASTHSIAVLPVATRLQRAVCPFCTSAGGKKTVMARGAELTLTDPEGRKLGYEGDKLINEIPDADVVDLASFLEDAEAPEPIFIVPDNDYDVSIGSTASKSGDEDDDDEATSVAIFSGGSSLTIGRNKREKGQRDTLSLSKDGDEIRYRTGNGKVPRLRLSVDDDKEGMVVGIRNIKADPDDEVDLKLDRKEGKVHLQGGGKKTESYDLKVRRVRAHADDLEVEAKGVKIRTGESHAIDVRTPKKSAKPGEAIGIQRGKAVERPRKVRTDKAKTEREQKDGKLKKDDKDPKSARDPKAAKDDKKSLRKEEPKKVAPPPAPQKKLPPRK